MFRFCPSLIFAVLYPPVLSLYWLAQTRTAYKIPTARFDEGTGCEATGPRTPLQTSIIFGYSYRYCARYSRSLFSGCENFAVRAPFFRKLKSKWEDYDWVMSYELPKSLQNKRKFAIFHDCTCSGQAFSAAVTASRSQKIDFVHSPRPYRTLLKNLVWCNKRL